MEVYEKHQETSIILLMKKSLKCLKTRVKIQNNIAIDISKVQLNYEIDYKKNIEKGGVFQIFKSNKYLTLLDKINLCDYKLEDICYCVQGIDLIYNEFAVLPSTKIDDKYHRMLDPQGLMNRYYIEWSGKWIIDDQQYLRNKVYFGITKLQENYFLKEKLLVGTRNLFGKENRIYICYHDIEHFYCGSNIFNIVLKSNDFNLKYINLILNSKLIKYYYIHFFGTNYFKPSLLKNIPIKKLNESMQHIFTELADLLFIYSKELQIVNDNLINIIKSRYPLIKLNWNCADLLQDGFDIVSNCFENQLFTLSFMELNELTLLLSKEKDRTVEIAQCIATIEEKINMRVYQLYGLSKTEIVIVENFSKVYV